MTPREFAAELDGWRWRHDQSRTRMWESAYLGRAKEFPDLDKWLDPPRTRRLTPEQVEERKTEFHKAVEASSKVPVRPRRNDVSQ